MSRFSKIAVVVPWRVVGEFLFSKELATLFGKNVDTIGSYIPRRQNILNRLLFIYPQYLFTPLKLFFLAKNYQKLIMWQQVYGIVLACLLRVFRVVDFPQIVILTFILTPKKRKGFRLGLIRFALECNFVAKVVVFSKPEFDLYKTLLPTVSEKFRYTLYTAADVECIEQYSLGDDGYFLAAGRSNRDYDFLVNYFCTRPHLRLVILSDQYSNVISKNVQVISDAFDERYYRYLSRCHAVLLPFKDAMASSGQLVFLHAIQFGKPVIATRSSCLDGYLIDGKHGYIIDKSECDLDLKVEALEDAGVLGSIAQFGMNDYKNRFGFLPLAINVCHFINE